MILITLEKIQEKLLVALAANDNFQNSHATPLLDEEWDDYEEEDWCFEPLNERT